MGDLEDDGFEMNPNDPCVANMEVEGKQMTVLWHVDDLFVTHEEPQEVTNFGSWLKAKYGNCKVQQGKRLQYLGIDLISVQRRKLKLR